MNKLFNTAVIGGGASGLLCAVELTRGESALSGESVIVFEKSDRVGKKLVATGNGQGNLTNINLSSENYHGNAAFLSRFFPAFSKIDIPAYFYKIGIPLTSGENGKMYPVSYQASAVLDTLRDYLNAKKVDIKTSCEVIATEYREDGYFKIQTGDGEYFARNVVFAFGGKAAKQFGTDGTAYALAEKYGHKITKLYPSLVQIKTEKQSIKGLSGIKERATVYALDGTKPLKCASGEVLFTDFGLSGSAIFAVSGYLSDAKNPYVVLEFLPRYSADETEKLIKDKKKNAQFSAKDDLLCGIVNKKLGKAVLKICGTENPDKIAVVLKNFRIKVKGTLGFDYAQVTKGGIDTADISPITMESLLRKNLFITGEALDIDGDCGGYNLSFAFVSGIIAAKEIKKRSQRR